MNLRKLFGRSSGEQKLDAELRHHLDEQIEANIAAGMAPEEARRQAMIAFGGVEKAKEECRDVRPFRLLEELRQDTAYALRMFRRSPTFVAVTLLSLALGIGATTAIFTLINGLMLRELPVREPERLVRLYTQTSGGEGNFSYPLFQELQKRNDILQTAVGARVVEPAFAYFGGGSTGERVSISLVSGNYFHGLGVGTVLGRTLDPADDSQPGAGPVAVISHALWKRRFAESPAVVGQTFRLNRAVLTIVGVAEPRFFGVAVGHPVDVWAPLTMHPAIFDQPAQTLLYRGWTWIEVIARLNPGVTHEQARAVVDSMFQTDLATETRSITDRERRRHMLDQRVELESAANGLSRLRKRASTPLKLLMGMVVLLLLITCANVANVFLARAAARTREISMRLALGAGRWRLVRQLLTESILLSVAGGATGVLFALWGSRLLGTLLVERTQPLAVDLQPDARVLAFAATLSVATGIACGLAPAFRTIRVALAAGVMERALAPGSPGRWRLAKSLVVVQVALCVVLLVGGGLFARSLAKLLAEEMGFTRQNVLVLSVNPRLTGYKDEALYGMQTRVLEQVRALPGVRAVAFADLAFGAGNSRRCCITVAGYTAQAREDRAVRQLVVTADYFASVGTPFLRGRDFAPADRQDTRRVAIINETMARYYFSAADPLGRTFWWGETPGRPGPIEIVGVVKDAKRNDVRETPERFIYFPASQERGVGPNFLVMRTGGRPEGMAESVRRAVARAEPNLGVLEIATLEQLVNGTLFQERALALLSNFFALLAMVLACIGLYGLMSYSVARRTREIGIRMALGADKGETMRLVLRESLALVVIGLAVGLPSAILAVRAFSSLLYGLSPADPVTIVGTVLVLAGVAALAAFVPVRRAVRVEPMVALRYE